MMLNAFGIALVFPILTLAILDMYPRQRGSASSLQAFTSLVSNALIAGVLSPLLSHTPLHLALGAAVFALLGWAFWRWEMHAGITCRTRLTIVRRWSRRTGCSGRLSSTRVRSGARRFHTYTGSPAATSAAPHSSASLPVPTSAYTL